MTDVDVRLNIAMTPRVFRGAFFLFCLTALPGELASESVTLNSYYPAPSGVYTQMIATGNTFLARDAGFVEIGTPLLSSGVGTLQTPANTTGIYSTKLVVYGGYTGIGGFTNGTSYPQAWVHVQDPRTPPSFPYSAVNPPYFPVVAMPGQMIVGTTADPVGGNNYMGMVYFDANHPTEAIGSPYIGTHGGSMITMTNGTVALNVDINGNVNVSPLTNPVGGQQAPIAQLDVSGPVNTTVTLAARTGDVLFPLPQ